jgi:hypothetical protein
MQSADLVRRCLQPAPWQPGQAAWLVWVAGGVAGQRTGGRLMVVVGLGSGGKGGEAVLAYSGAD